MQQLMLLVSIVKRQMQRVSGGLGIILEEDSPFRLRLDSECNPSFFGCRGAF